MIQLYDAGVYLLHGIEIVESGQEIGLRTGREVSKEEAAKNTRNTIRPERWRNCRSGLIS